MADFRNFNINGVDASIALADSTEHGLMSLNDYNSLRTLENSVDTLNNGGIILKDSVIAADVSNWLNNHPEATTTVQDKSVTMAKLADGVLEWTNNTNGMNYVILDNDSEFSNQVSTTDTIYEIRYDYDLNSDTVTVPENCILKFVGGSLANGTLVGNHTVIESPLYQIFDTIAFSGTFDNLGYPEYFGAKGNSSNYDDSIALNVCIAAVASLSSTQYKYRTINLQGNRTYNLISTCINIPYDGTKKISINGNGANIYAVSDTGCYIFYGYDKTEGASGNGLGGHFYIKNVTFSAGVSLTHGIRCAIGVQDLHIDNIVVYNAYYSVYHGYKIYDTDSSSSSNCHITGSFFHGNGCDSTGAGIYFLSADNYINNCRIYGAKYGIQCNGAIVVTSTHVLWRGGSTIDDTAFLYTNYSGYAIINSCYCDTMQNIVHATMGGCFVITNTIYYSYRGSTYNDTYELFNFENITGSTGNRCHITIKNNLFTLPAQDTVGFMPRVFASTSVINIGDNILYNQHFMKYIGDLLYYNNKYNKTIETGISYGTRYIARVCSGINTVNGTVDGTTNLTRIFFDIYYNQYYHYIACIDFSKSSQPVSIVSATAYNAIFEFGYTIDTNNENTIIITAAISNPYNTSHNPGTPPLVTILSSSMRVFDMPYHSISIYPDWAQPTFNGTPDYYATSIISNGNTDNRPSLTSDDIGYQYFDTSINKPIYYTGTKWVDATGTSV